MTSFTRTLLACSLLCLPASAQMYWHRVTGTIGGIVPKGGLTTAHIAGGPLLSLDYGFRFSRHGQFDAAIDTGFVSRYDERTNVYIPRVGYRVVVPFWDDRIETHIGFGGAHTLFKPKVEEQVWLVYGQLGANYALDRDRRYRAGMSVRWYRDPIGRPVQQWVAVGGEVSYSWGR